MASSSHAARRSTQPQGVVEPDWSHNMLRSPLVFWAANERGYPAGYRPGRTPASGVTAPKFESMRSGTAYLTAGTTAVPQFGTAITVNNFTAFWYGLASHTGAVDPQTMCQAGENYPTTPRNACIIQMDLTTRVRFEAHINGTGTTLSPTVTAGETTAAVAVRIGTTVYCYLNGRRVGTITVGSTMGVSLEKPMVGAHYYSGSLQQVGLAHKHQLFGVVDRPWNDVEVASFSANPWQLFKPEARIHYFPTAAGGGARSALAGPRFSLAGVRGLAG